MNSKIAAASLSATLALGVGLGRATVPTPRGPKFERICVEADGSAQVYTDDDGRKVQLLITPDHSLPVQTRTGRKVASAVPSKLSAAIKSVSAEAAALAANAGQ